MRKRATTYRPDHKPQSAVKQAEERKRRKEILAKHEQTVKLGHPAKWDDIAEAVRKEQGAK
jgi:hypothetical protein